MVIVNIIWKAMQRLGKTFSSPYWTINSRSFWGFDIFMSGRHDSEILQSKFSLWSYCQSASELYNWPKFKFHRFWSKFFTLFLIQIKFSANTFQWRPPLEALCAFTYAVDTKLRIPVSLSRIWLTDLCSNHR